MKGAAVETNVSVPSNVAPSNVPTRLARVIADEVVSHCIVIAHALTEDVMFDASSNNVFVASARLRLRANAMRCNVHFAVILFARQTGSKQ